MKVLQLIQKQQLRGAEIFASQLSQHLADSGHEVILVSLFTGNAELPFSGKKYNVGASNKNRFFDFRAWRKLRDLIEEFNPDIIQANAGDTLKYAVFSKLFFRWKAKIIFRNANLMSAFFKGGIHRSFNRWLLSRCSYFISVSENCRQDLIKIYPDAAANSTTIPIGAHHLIEAIAPVARNSSAQEPVFISIGSFVPEKNHIFLLEVFHLYFKQNGNGFLWLVGDGKLRGSLEKKIEEITMKDRVYFWGYRSDVIAILKSADVFIMTSLIEGLPAVILEAISCEIPVVASGVGGIPEIIENDVTGICIQQWSADLYVKSLSALLTNPEYKARLVRQAKLKFLEKFTIEKVATDFMVQYQKLIG